MFFSHIMYKEMNKPFCLYYRFLKHHDDNLQRDGLDRVAQGCTSEALKGDAAKTYFKGLNTQHKNARTTGKLKSTLIVLH